MMLQPCDLSYRWGWRIETGLAGPAGFQGRGTLIKPFHVYINTVGRRIVSPHNQQVHYQSVQQHVERSYGMPEEAASGASHYDGAPWYGVSFTESTTVLPTL